MLYDNGALLALYSDAYLVAGDERFARVVAQSIAWAEREMRAPEGGFFSALDADSEGEEGRFYVWSRDAVAALLSADEFAVISAFYGLDGAPNFEGHWHFRVARPVDAGASALGRALPEVNGLLPSARSKLLQARALRVRPGLDVKVLTPRQQH